MTAGATVTCTNHCSACNRHFHSLQAFDAHHIRDDTGWPVCLDPVDLEDRFGYPRLVALTEHGACRVYAKPQTDCKIWTMAGYERARVLRDAPETCDQAG